MKKEATYTIIFTILIFSILIFSYPTSTNAQEVEDEREFDYIKGSEKGPERWGEIKKEWEDCKIGKLQSPIDMSDQRVKVVRTTKDPIKTSYKPCNATIKNRGHDIAVEWKGNNSGTIEINGTNYHLQQLHWHSPSEHTINGRRYDMELHMVHVSLDPNVENKIAVIGVLYKAGRPNKFLSRLLDDIISLEDKKSERDMGVFDPNELKIMRSKKYYRYMGSLTVPPCTQGVIWTINKKVRTVSRKQVKALRTAVQDYAEQNARPVQALNQRDVMLYDS